MFEHHLKEFRKSGLSDETIVNAGYESQEEKIVDDGFDDLGRKRKKKYGSHWRVAYTHPITKEFYYYRIKPDEPKLENKGKSNEREIKYLTPKNAEPHLYFSKQIDNWEEKLKSNQTIYITEGEKKTDRKSVV